MNHPEEMWQKGIHPPEEDVHSSAPTEPELTPLERLVYYGVVRPAGAFGDWVYELVRRHRIDEVMLARGPDEMHISNVLEAAKKAVTEIDDEQYWQPSVQLERGNRSNSQFLMGIATATSREQQPLVYDVVTQRQSWLFFAGGRFGSQIAQTIEMIGSDNQRGAHNVRVHRVKAGIQAGEVGVSAFNKLYQLDRAAMDAANHIHQLVIIEALDTLAYELSVVPLDARTLIEPKNQRSVASLAHFLAWSRQSPYMHVLATTEKPYAGITNQFDRLFHTDRYFTYLFHAMGSGSEPTASYWLPSLTL